MIKLLIVDDSALVRKLLGGVFATDTTFVVEFARTGAEALLKLETFNPDVVTLDVNMPGMDGLTCLDRIMLESPRPVVMVSSVTNAGADATFEAMRLGAVDVIAKPSGAVSLDIHDLAPALISKVRAAASAKVTDSRLRARIQQKTGMVKRMALSRDQTRATQTGAASRLRGSGVVVVGVSTGGPPALEKLLADLPGDFGWPIVIAQHMPATFTGALARRLDKLCAVTVAEVDKVMRLEPNHVYVARGSADIIVSARPSGPVVMPAPPKAGYLWQPSVERLVRTAMDTFAPVQILAVMLTGMGSDGSAAMAELHRSGGQVVAESDETAVIWGMPGEVVRGGGADWVLPIGEIADILQKLVPPCP